MGEKHSHEEKDKCRAMNTGERSGQDCICDPEEDAHPCTIVTETVWV